MSTPEYISGKFDEYERRIEELKQRINNLEITVKSLEFIREKRAEEGRETRMERIRFPLIRCDMCGRVHHYDVGCD